MSECVVCRTIRENTKCGKCEVVHQDESSYGLMGEFHFLRCTECDGPVVLHGFHHAVTERLRMTFRLNPRD